MLDSRFASTAAILVAIASAVVVGPPVSASQPAPSPLVIESCVTVATGYEGEIIDVTCISPCGVYGCEVVLQAIPGTLLVGETCSCIHGDPTECCHLVAGNSTAGDPPGWWVGMGFCGGSACSAGTCTVTIEEDGDYKFYSAACE